MFVHDGQFAVGDIGFENGNGGSYPTSSAASDDGRDKKDRKGWGWHYDPQDNEHVDLATIGVIGILAGAVQSGDVEAESTVNHIKNASVDSSATAIANLHSIDVEAEYATDVMVIADLVQFSYMDVEATSDVSKVSVDRLRRS